MFKPLMKNWKKKAMTLAMAGSLGLSLVPLSTEAAVEYTVLGVGDYAVQNDLNNGDATVFRNRMDGLGWTKTAEWYNSAVYHSDFTKYGNQSDILYHTGHGMENGYLALRDYGYSGGSSLRQFAYYNQVGGDIKGATDTPYEDAEWMIFATCSALEKMLWGKQLANGLHHFFGYHDVSLDYTDNKIIDNFINRVFAKNGYTGETMFSAWMQANNMYSEHDWAIIGHNGNKNDYMHGVKTGATADITGTADVYRWKGYNPYPGSRGYEEANISSYLKSGSEINEPATDAEVEQLNQKYRVKFKVRPEKLNMKTITTNLVGQVKKTANNGYNRSKVYQGQNGTLEVHKDNSFVYSRQIVFEPITESQEEVQKNIQSFIEKNGGWRDDLVLQYLLPLTEEDAEGKETVTGYTAVFVQKLEGSYIDGEAADAIRVGYDKQGINFYKRNIKEVTEKVKVQNKSVEKREKALKKAVEKVNSHFKNSGNLEFKKAELVYFSAPIGLGLEKDELRPAYKFSVSEMNSIYIDALTGEHLNGAQMLGEQNEEDIPADASSPEFKEQYERDMELLPQETEQEME